MYLPGITGNNTLKYQGISSIIALIAQFCAILFIDRTGRRWPLILGNLGNMVTFIIATILLAKFPPGVSTNTGGQWGFIVMTWLYNFCFSCTCGPLSWIIPSEVFDTRTRSKGVSIATMTSFAFNTMIVRVWQFLRSPCSCVFPLLARWTSFDMSRSCSPRHPFHRSSRIH
jgi:MFS family permease